MRSGDLYHAAGTIQQIQVKTMWLFKGHRLSAIGHTGILLLPRSRRKYCILIALGSKLQTMRRVLHQRRLNHRNFLPAPFGRAQLAESSAGGRAHSCSVPEGALRPHSFGKIWHAASGRSVAQTWQCSSPPPEVVRLVGCSRDFVGHTCPLPLLAYSTILRGPRRMRQTAWFFFTTAAL